ncbi:Flp pilus assembly pilin Flp [Natronobacillus azotifigens]|uniref:Flp1 family type IVb pilin n=1 Tax=Natronobacillus azotifigens TaxID=472978 RepID=A0A9J6RCQ2_9BACI|nr:Flp1 family type IVb pilin [Natronobacillus azotifigens]MCZ0703134.1 Flp1 family type IVb pilin [Natronobacillus azotifigens]
MKKVKERFISFWKEEEGLGTLEILLIIVVLVGIALLFGSTIRGWVQNLLNNIGENIPEVEVP